MSTAAPEAATVYLDEPTPDNPPNHRQSWRDARTQRFSLLGLGAVAVTGSATVLRYGEASLPWLLLLAAGALGMAASLAFWMRRPFLRLAGDGLTFRRKPLGRTHTVRWDELAHVDATSSDEAVRLHRTGDAPTLPLSFDALSAEAAHRLTRRLTDTARHHGVLVYPN